MRDSTVGLIPTEIDRSLGPNPILTGAWHPMQVCRTHGSPLGRVPPLPVISPLVLVLNELRRPETTVFFVSALLLATR